MCPVKRSNSNVSGKKVKLKKLFQLFQSQKLYIGQWDWCLQKRLGRVELTNEQQGKFLGKLMKEIGAIFKMRLVCCSEC